MGRCRQRQTDARSLKKERKGRSSKGKNVVPKAKPGPSTVVKKKMKPADDRSESTSIQPLSMDHILENVLQFVLGPGEMYFRENETVTEEQKANVQDMRNVRLVSKQWNEAATKLIRRKSQIIFGMSCVENEHPLDLIMIKFMDTMQHTAMLPVQRFCIGPCFFTKQNEKLWSDFLRNIGPSIVDLAVHYTNFAAIRFYRRSFPNLQLVKLKKLEFIIQEYWDKKRTIPIPWLVFSLLGAATALQEFHLQVPRLDEVVCSQIPKTVKVLRLDVPIVKQNLITLLGKNLKLHEFHVNVHYISGTVAFRNFLQQQSNLSLLNINDSHETGSMPIDFPRMEQLSRLELLGGRIRPFSFPDIFPKLKVLYMMDCDDEDTAEQILPPGKPSNSMEEVTFPVKISLLPLVIKVGRCFPNLKAVHLHRPRFPDLAEFLPEVFLYCTQIETLNVSCMHISATVCYNVDTVFSGVPEKDCKRILRRRSFNRVNLQELQEMPSILNLTKLKTLRMSGLRRETNFTDFTARLVFMNMESLKELQVNKFEMSPKSLKMLKAKLSLEFINHYRRYF